MKKVMFDDRYGLTLEEVMQQNLDKLASRRERGVIDGNGDKSDNRRDNLVCFPKAEHTRRHQIERKNDTHRSIFGNRRVCPRRALGRMEDARYL